MMTVGTKFRKMWLQSVRTLVLLNATSSSSMASRSRRSPSFCRYSKEASCQSGRIDANARGPGLETEPQAERREESISPPPNRMPGKESRALPPKLSSVFTKFCIFCTAML